MRASTYVAERQFEFWTSQQIEAFFCNAGFRIEIYPVTQKVERYLPADYIFGCGNLIKLFGIQYKALYRGSSDYWRLTKSQHNHLIHFPWIYYGLSDLRSVSDSRNSLHYLKILNPSFTFVEKLKVSNLTPHYLWGQFYQHLQSCQTGRLVESVSELHEAISPCQDERLNRTVLEITELFIANFNTKHLLHLSPRLREDEHTEIEDTGF